MCGVIPTSWTASDALMVFPSKDMFVSMFLYFETNISWNFDGLVTILKSLGHCITVLVSSSSLLEMASKSFPQGYSVTSSGKLHIAVSFMKRSKSLTKTLKRK